MPGFSKTKKVGPKGTLLDQFSQLANKAQAIADTDTGGGETARLRKMLKQVTDELDRALEEVNRLTVENDAVRKQAAKLKDQARRLQERSAEVEKDALRVQELIRKYGEVEKNLAKAIQKTIDSYKDADIEDSPPSDDEVLT